MARARGAVVIAVFVGVTASLLPTHAVLATMRTPRHEVSIDATAVVLPEVVATTRRAAARELAQLFDRLATTPPTLLLLLVAVFAGLAMSEVAGDSRLRFSGVRTRAPPSLSRAA